MTKFSNPKSHGNPPELKGQVFKRPSMTIPDQTLSLREIVDRFVRKQPVPVIQEMSYDYGSPEEASFDDIAITDIQNMDISERAKLKTELNAAMAAAKQKAKVPKMSGTEKLPTAQIKEDMFELPEEKV